FLQKPFPKGTPYNEKQLIPNKLGFWRAILFYTAMLMISHVASRHTFGTMMMTVGADLYTTCKLMGHADVRTTQIYAKIVDSKKIEAVNMVDRMFEKMESEQE
ncbi:tyrosine-type recombinase/integrase, partial [Barnesiella intestinihominis]|uniref:tyrosine-type recombinase/integrase n=1 Tax=Barnesiella intestinihominis TaxID=487174 RepID=UPI003AF095E8